MTVAISGETVIVGTLANAYVFVRGTGVWTQQQKLLQSDAMPGSQFGRLVAISGETAVVSGAYDRLGEPTMLG